MDARNRTAVLPQVLADRECDVDSADARHETLVTGDEIAELVEHAIVRQVVLRVGAHDLAAMQHSKTVLRPTRIATEVAHDDCDVAAGSGIKSCREVANGCDRRDSE